MMNSNDESAAVRAGHAYFKTTPERAEKGSAMSMIETAKEIENGKTAKLKAAREERDAVQAVADAGKAKKPAVKRTRKTQAPLPS
ncbi:MAG: hypothetical protein H7Y08_03320 [Rhizobiaceae bacterium]|nr:hypothetical protein [Rhizobiaceae bacterium]